MDKLNYAKEITVFKQQILLTQKDTRRALYSTHNKGEHTELESTERGLENTLQSWTQNLFRSLKRVSAHIKDLTAGVKGIVERTHTYGADPHSEAKMQTLQRATEGVETELRDFKETCRKEYEALCIDEATLTSDITQLMQRFESWDAAPVAEPRPKTMHVARRGSETDPHKLEVMKLDREILDLGGPSLGWDDDEHKAFMKLRTQYKHKLCPAFFRDAANLLPLFDQEAIEDHCDRHDTLLRLQLKKRNLLSAWREAKLKKAEDANEFVEEAIPKSKPAKRPESADMTRKQIEEWRQTQKETKERIQAEKKEEERKRTEATAARKAMQMRKKQQVAEFKERKEYEKFHKQLVDNYAKKRNTVDLTDEDKERLRLREEKLLQKRLQITELKARAEEQKRIKEAEGRLKTEASWAYVDSRLQQETTAFIKRKEDKKRENRAESFGGQLLRTTGRAIPSWRAGVSR